MKTYKKIAITLEAIENCDKSGNDAARRGHDAVLAQIENELPSGSGFDCGTRINREKSTPSRIVLDTDFHHMDSNGYYCGWSSLTVTVTASMVNEFDLHINCHGSKRAQSDINYFYDVFDGAMTRVTSAKWKWID